MKEADEKITLDLKLQLLLAEYERLQHIVEEFDSKALSIKAWSVTVGAAGMVTAYIEGSPQILVVAAITSLIFWIVEALWKVNQQAFYGRIYEIENFIDKDASEQPALQIATSWSRNWRAKGRERLAFEVLLWPHVFLPHMGVALAALVLLIFATPIPAAQ